MGLFRGGRRQAEESADSGAQDGDGNARSDAEERGDVPERTGPWDVEEVEDRGPRLDLGAIWLPAVNGMQLRMEANKQRGMVTGASVNVGGSSLQVQVFAAPRSAGIWDEIREEIAESVRQQGGSVDDLPGPFGRELLARLPVRTSEGRSGHRPARFVGVDGPRWFLRGVLSGEAAVDPESARTLEGVFADIVVVRGSEARAPRELLTLSMPQAAAAQGAETTSDTPQLSDPFKRGPEITEVR